MTSLVSPNPPNPFFSDALQPESDDTLNNNYSRYANSAFGGVDDFGDRLPLVSSLSETIEDQGQAQTIELQLDIFYEPLAAHEDLDD